MTNGYDTNGHFSLTETAKRCILTVIDMHNINIHQNYDLFLFTTYIEDNLDYNQREAARLTTTGEVMTCISMMIDKHII